MFYTSNQTNYITKEGFFFFNTKKERALMVDAIPFAMPSSLGFSIWVKVAKVLTCLVIQPCVCGLPARAPVYVFACFEPRLPPISLFTQYCWMPLSLSLGPSIIPWTRLLGTNLVFFPFPCSPPVISLCLHLNRVTPKPPSQQQIVVSLYSEYCALLSPRFTLLSDECRRVLGSAA